LSVRTGVAIALAALGAYVLVSWLVVTDRERVERVLDDVRAAAVRGDWDASRLLTLSQTAFTPAVIGMARIRPMAPQSVPQNIRATVTTSGLRWTLDPTTLGYRRFSASR
jgi:hypothetical protein